MVSFNAASSIWEVHPDSWQRIEQILMNEGTPKASTARKSGREKDGVVVVKDPYYIVASSPLADDLTRVLKHGETFAVFDHYGDVKPAGLGEEGLFHEGTRFLSSSILRLGQDRPLMLSSTVRDDNVLLTVDLTNPDLYDNDQVAVQRGTLHLFRSKFLWEGNCYESIRVRNYGLGPVTVALALQFEADFADVFEVRGTRRKQRGEHLKPVVAKDNVVLAYQGLDGVVRRTHLHFTPYPTALNAAEATYRLELRPQEEATLYVAVSCATGTSGTARLSFDNARTLASAALEGARRDWCDIYTSNEQFNDWLNRSLSDLHMMTTNTEEGPYPYAGVPWFSTAFGRDGILTALQCLWANPALARGVLAYLAAHQATEKKPQQDAEPGKILHETRRGEMAALGEIPFGCYYGSVDATPLFVLLAGAYFERTGDLAFVEGLWPNLQRALEWIDTCGDPDGDGFVEYARHTPKGLVQQGWKDSQDSIFHADGTLAQGPIALCEVQGYVYAARLAAARMAQELGEDERARQLSRQAEELRERFEQAFWCEELSTYALALDGAKRPCRVRSSNAGQCLFTKIASPARAQRLAQTLMHEDSFSGWGVRTIAAGEARYNPMSYHNGSIWPHDNSLIAYGLSQYQLQDAALKVLTGMFDASLFVDLHRLPELFCGFPRRPGAGPTLYPVACAPQAWASGSVLLLLQACLGLRIDAAASRLCFSYPRLPEFLQQIQLRNLTVGKARVDILVRRHQDDVGVEVLKRQGKVEVVLVK